MHRQNFSAICATVFISMGHSELIKHSLCKTFSKTKQTWPQPWVLCVICTSDSWGFAAFSSRLVHTVPLAKRKEEGLVWWVSELGCVLGSSTHRCKCAQVPLRLGLRAVGQWGKGISDIWAGGCSSGWGALKWSVSWPHTTQTLWNALLKQWAIHGSCEQTHTHKTGVRVPWRVWMPSLLPASTLPEAVILECPLHVLLHQIFLWEIFTQQDTWGVCTFWNRGKVP